MNHKASEEALEVYRHEIAAANEVKRWGGKVNRESFLQIHGIDPKAWCEKHGIEPFDAVCPSCECSLKMDVPIMRKKSPGLMAEECSCGTSNRPYCFLVTL